MEENLQQETIPKEKKKLGRLQILLIVLAVLLCAAAVVALVVLNPFGSGSGVTEPGADTVQGNRLYWNVDREAYLAESASGLTSRRKIDGFFTVRFLVDGEIVEYKVADSRLMIQIDANDLMGLTFDEEGIVVGIVNVRDFATELAPNYYIVEIDGNNYTANSMGDGSGISKKFTVTENTKIYNVSSGAENPGEPCELNMYSRVRVFVDSDGNVTDIFVLENSSFLAYCEHCQGEAVFRTWTSSTSLPTSTGHYCLQSDVTLPKGQANIEQDADVIIDLNGKTVTGPYGFRVIAMFYENCKLSILDSSEAQTGRVVAVGTYATGSGQCVWVRYGVFNLYGGTLDASGATCTGNGAAVNVAAGCEFNMYGGEIVGGTTQSGINANGGVNARYGGNIYITAGATMNMYGGVIRDGYSESITIDGSIKGGYGGNIYAGSNSVVNIYGGEIKDGKADMVGGNIAHSGTVNMYGGVISGGQIVTVNHNSGNVHITGSSAVFNLYGGEIKDGSSTGYGGNITNYGTLRVEGGSITGAKTYSGKTMDELTLNMTDQSNIYGRNCTFIMTGGYIDGYVKIFNTDTNNDGVPEACPVQISGNARICGGSYNLTLGGTVAIEIGTMTAGAEIRMSSGGYISTETVESNKQYFKFDNEKILTTEYVDKKLFIGKYQCVCASSDGNHIGECDGIKVTWNPIKGSALPTTTGNYFLVEDMLSTTQAVIAKGADVKIDLNGFKIKPAPNPGAAVEGGTYNYYRVFVLQNEGAKLSLTDSVGGGTIFAGDRGDSGSIVWVNKESAVFNMYGGILDGSTQKETTSTAYNGIVNVSVGTANIYGGELKGASSITRIDKKTNAPLANGKTTIVGGTLNAAAKGTVNFYGGKIIAFSGTAGNGGAVSVLGTFNILSGKNCSMPTIIGGIASNGGAIYIDGGTFTMETGVIYSGSATAYGGGLYINNAATVTISGGEIHAGKSNTAGNQTGNTGDTVFIGKNGKTVDDATVYGDVKLIGGTIYGGVDCSNGTSLSIGGSLVIKDQDKDGNTVTGLRVTSVPPAILALTADADIKVELAGTVGTFAEGAAATYTNQVSASATLLKTLPDAMDIVDGDKLIVTVIKRGCLCGNSTEDGNGENCVGNCDGTWLTWEAWTGASLPVTPGNWYLTKDIENCAQANLGTAAGTVNLDLNGYTVTMALNTGATDEKAGAGKGSYNYYPTYVFNSAANYVTLNITDNSADGDGRIVSGKRNNAGTIIKMNNKGEFNLYGGILDGTTFEETTESAVNGLVVTMAANKESVFRMYGGTIIGTDSQITKYAKGENGAASDTKLLANGAVASLGGNTIEIHGGTIQGGVGGNGGSVYLSADDTFLMTGGTVTGGNAVNGGNIYVSAAAAVTIEGGFIENGTATAYGGNLYINQGCTFEMTGGEIYGGTCSNGANVFVGGNAGGSVTITGGTVYGGLTTSGNTVTLGGTAKVTDLAKDGETAVEGIVLTNGAYVTVSECEEDADFAFALTTGKVAQLAEGATADALRPSSTALATDETAALTVTGSDVSYPTPDTGDDDDDDDDDTGTTDGTCLCGRTDGTHFGACDGTSLEWQDWTSDSSLPTSGNYRLTTSVALNNPLSFSQAGTLNLDLNGYTITNTKYIIATPNSDNNHVVDVNIVDHAGGGKIDASGSTSTQGGIAQVGKNTTLSVYGGTFIGGTQASWGGTFYSNWGGTFNLYGGEIYGGIAATDGDNLFVGSSGIANLSGGTIYGSNGKGSVISTGGVITLSGSIQILDVTKDGTAAYGFIANKVFKVGTFTAGAEVCIDLAPGATSDTKNNIGSFVDTAAAEAYNYQLLIGQKTQAINADTDVAVLPNATTATQLDIAAGRVGCVCGGKAVGVGDHVCENVLWTAWTNGSKLPNTDGNYYLTTDVEATTQFSAVAGSTVSIDLNGHTVSTVANSGSSVGNYFRIFPLDKSNMTLNITDNSANGNGRIESGTKSANIGNIIWIGNNSSANTNVTVNIFGGILDGSTHTQTTATELKGSPVVMDSKSTDSCINMYGGKIIGADQTALGIDKLYGGAVYINYSHTFNMYGGEIVGATGNKGGAIQMDKLSTDGTDDMAVFNMYGGSIHGGSVTGNGGNLNITAGTFTMYGGEIYGGHADGEGDNIRLGSSGYAVFLGGTVYGGVGTAQDQCISIGKDAMILDTAKGTETVSYGVKLNGESNVIVVLGGDNALTENANVVVTGAATDRVVAVFADDSAKEAYAYQLSNSTADTYLKADGNNLVVATGRVQCICGGNAVGVGDHVCENVLWTAWTSANSLPNSGNYYLTTNVTLSTNGGVAANSTLNLDLNGHSIDVTQNGQSSAGNYFRPFVLEKAGSTLNITDTSAEESGKIYGGIKGDAGLAIRITASNATLNIFGGTISGEKVTQTGGATVSGLIQINAADSTINMYGGTIIGLDRTKITSSSTNANPTTLNGASIQLNAAGNLNIYGGTIKNGNGTNGGNIYAAAGSAVTMSGGIVEGGYASTSGGNIYVNPASFTMTGGIIRNGSAGTGTNTTSYGGNLMVNGGSAVSITGGEIYGGYAAYLGSNVYVGGNDGVGVSITGGTIYGGVSTSSNLITVGGDARILNVDKDGSSVSGIRFRNDGNYVTISALGDDASVAFEYKATKVAVGATADDLDNLVAPDGYECVIPENTTDVMIQAVSGDDDDDDPA